MNAFDVNLVRLLNGLAGRNHILGQATAAFTTYAPLILLALLLGAFLPRGPRARERRRSLIVAGMAGVAGVLISVLVGLFVYRARPFAVLPPGTITPLIPHAADSSFPSDHVMGSAAIAAALWPVPNALTRVAFAVVAVMLAASRVAAGVHWPTDVLASLVIGGLVGSGVAAVMRPLHPLIDRLVDWYGRIEARITGKG